MTITTKKAPRRRTPVPPAPVDPHDPSRIILRLRKEKGLLLRCYTQVGGRGHPREEQGWPQVSWPLGAQGPGLLIPHRVTRSEPLTQLSLNFPFWKAETRTALPFGTW